MDQAPAANNMEDEDVPAAMAPANPGNDNLGAQMRNLGQRKLQLNISLFNLMLFIFAIFVVAMAIAIWMSNSNSMKSVDDENEIYISMKMEINKLKEEMTKKEETFKNEIKGLKREIVKKEKFETSKEIKEEMANKNEGKFSMLVDNIMANFILVCWIQVPIFFFIFGREIGSRLNGRKLKKENALKLFCLAIAFIFVCWILVPTLLLYVLAAIISTIMIGEKMEIEKNLPIIIFCGPFVAIFIIVGTKIVIIAFAIFVIIISSVVNAEIFTIICNYQLT